MSTIAGHLELTCPHRRWGKTELSIPVIPFGTQGFGNHFGHVDDQDAVALVRSAVDIGVNHFDCARCYGDSLRNGHARERHPGKRARALGRPRQREREF